MVGLPSRFLFSIRQDTKEASLDNPVGLRHDLSSNNTITQERSGRSVSREGARGSLSAGSRGGHNQTAGNKRYEMDLTDDAADAAPGISSAELDQLMEDFDLNDPLLEEEEESPVTTTTTTATTTTTTTSSTESKLGSLAGALPGGLGAGLSSGLSSLSNPMGKLGEMASQNPVTGAMSKGKDFLFKKFGL